MPTLSKPEKINPSIYFTCGNKSCVVFLKKAKNKRLVVHNCFSEAVRYFGWVNRHAIRAFSGPDMSKKFFDYYSYHKFIGTR
jgi:hypothetical protein